MDSKATAIAVNFVICRPLTSNDLQNFTIPIGNCDYATLKSNFDPIKTDTINHSIDFLPDHEYTMFRVVSNINVTDPQCVLPQTPLPTKVLIYQGNTQEHQQSFQTCSKGQTCKTSNFAYPPIHETFFTDDEDNEDQQDDPPQIPLQSPDALTSSTRTDFTYPPIEDLTKTLLKYAKNANLRKLSYPTDLVARRRQFNAFMDNLRIVCNISPWTRQVFDLWPKQISYSHPFIGTAIYNLIFTHVCDPCQKHIIDGPPDARTAIFTLRRHCAPLTPDHVERTREAFYSIKQGHNEVATSYLNRIRVLTRDCYHAGIPNTDADLIKRAIRGGSNHHFYAASYQRFDADLRRAELNDEELPAFSELESHLLNIDESRGLTLPSQNQRNYNQHANAARQQFHRLPIVRLSKNNSPATTSSSQLNFATLYPTKQQQQSATNQTPEQRKSAFKPSEQSPKHSPQRSAT
ncbi:hypothetical protein MHU86_4899 [Fragilaria crotonensis]|nr:hypothetical protein MHU86_4899 [Fragilaria crotonensis]